MPLSPEQKPVTKFRMNGMYDMVYHTYEQNCNITKISSNTPCPGTRACGERATNRVNPNVMRYMLVATTLTGMNILLTCFHGPVRKNELMTLSTLPSVK